MAGAPYAAPGTAFRTLAEDKAIAVTNVRQLGGKTFYLRNKKWVDSTITTEQEKNVKQLKRFSPEYFELITKFGKDVGKYAASDDEVTVVLEGQAYSFSREFGARNDPDNSRSGLWMEGERCQS